MTLATEGVPGNTPYGTHASWEDEVIVATVAIQREKSVSLQMGEADLKYPTWQ